MESDVGKQFAIQIFLRTLNRSETFYYDCQRISDFLLFLFLDGAASQNSRLKDLCWQGEFRYTYIYIYVFFLSE